MIQHSQDADAKVTPVYDHSHRQVTEPNPKNQTKLRGLVHDASKTLEKKQKRCYRIPLEGGRGVVQRGRHILSCLPSEDVSHNTGKHRCQESTLGRLITSLSSGGSMNSRPHHADEPVPGRAVTASFPEVLVTVFLK